MNQQKENVTVLIITRDHYDQRIINLLKSLECQSYPKGLIETILIDYDKDKRSIPRLREICERFQIKGVSVESDSWDRSHAIYIGLKKATSKYVLVSDAKFLFEKNYIEECIRTINENNKQALYGKTRFWPEGGIASGIEIQNKEDFKKYLEEIRPNDLQRNFIIKDIHGCNEEDDHIDSFSDIPKFPQKLPGTLWGMTTFFNPAGYDNKEINYRKFRENSKRQQLKLLTVELAFGDDPFRLTEEDADVLIQLRTQAVMWQKERLLNIGLQHLPKDCDKIVWIDGDLIFKDDHWVKKTCKLLEEYNIIQPYSGFVRLPKGVNNFDQGQEKDHEGSIKGMGFVYSLVHGSFKVGNPGHAWAARREIFDEIGFYDRLIIGSADKLMAYAFIGYIDVGFKREHNIPMQAHQGQWMRAASKKIKQSVYYGDGLVLHLWHGDEKDRQHVNRGLILFQNEFDPEKDIKLDNNGCWAWNSEKPELHKNVKEYFWIRKEDGRS